MRTNNRRKQVVALAAGMALMAGTSHASISIDFVYDGVNDFTQVNYSGTFDVDLPAAGSGSGLHYINPRGVTLAPDGVDTHSYVSDYSQAYGYVPWSTYDGNPANWIVGTASSYSGDYFQFESDTNGWVLRGPTGSGTGDPVSGWMKFDGQNLTELGLAASGSSGDFTGNFGTVSWSVEAIPEPSVITLSVLFGGGMLFVRRRLMM